MDGNMLSNGYINCEFDSGNRLLKAGVNEYVYNAEDVRIKNLCQGDVTTYTYNTNCKLSQLLQKTTNGITTKYVYGLCLIGEEKCGEFKTYHFDYRGSTVAITDECGNIIDTLKYDTYGNVTEHIGDSFVIFGYNGRDGVITDRNGLLYMRARYYSPAIRRFVNADILHGEISDSTSLNRYSYVNGNPVSFVDPFGMASEERGMSAPKASHNSMLGACFGDDIFSPYIRINGQEYNKFEVNMRNQRLLINGLSELLKYYSSNISISTSSKQTLYSDALTTITLSTALSKGDGSVNFTAVFNDQIEILKSKEFATFLDDFTYSVSSDKSVTFTYSGELDEFSSFAVNLSMSPDLTTSYGYEITTKKDDWSFSTALEMEKTLDLTNSSKPQVSTSVNSSASFLTMTANTVVAVGITVGAGFAIAETFLTLGGGLWNDALVVGGAIKAWENVAQSFAAFAQ